MGCIPAVTDHAAFHHFRVIEQAQLGILRLGGMLQFFGLLMEGPVLPDKAFWQSLMQGLSIRRGQLLLKNKTVMHLAGRCGHGVPVPFRQGLADGSQRLL